MADLKSAGAQRLRPASPPHVDHRQPFHDALCRCRDCKPSHPSVIAQQRRVRFWTSVSLLFVLTWAVYGYVKVR